MKIIADSFSPPCKFIYEIISIVSLKIRMMLFRKCIHGLPKIVKCDRCAEQVKRGFEGTMKPLLIKELAQAVRSALDKI